MKTIDPIEHAKFKVSRIESEHSSTFTSPALLVNANCSWWKNYLFVQSKLMGKQEDETRFKYSTVLDIYDLKKSVYLYSVYLPLLNDHPIRQFKVIGGLIYTLTDNNIASYTIKLPDK